jgi:major membrane immunogen (membrane-anchored lipoprotein)
MKKYIIALMAVLAVFAAVSVGAQAKLKDGFYYAEEAAYPASGWRYQVVLEVKGGKIVAATWNGLNNKGLPDKKPKPPPDATA